MTAKSDRPGGSTIASMVLMRREAQPQGGATVNGTYVSLHNLPYLSEYKSDAALSQLVTQVGGVSNLNNNALNAYEMALLFRDTAKKAAAPDRQTLFAALKKETSFTADGIIGPTNVASGLLSACIVIAQLQNGMWQRVYPAKAGTSDCASGNVTQIKMKSLFRDLP